MFKSLINRAIITQDLNGVSRIDVHGIWNGCGISDIQVKNPPLVPDYNDPDSKNVRLRRAKTHIFERFRAFEP